MKGNLKSRKDVEFLTELFVSFITDDMVRQHGGRKDFLKDASVLVRRVQQEGLSFLTKTLPTLGKALDRALLDGRFTPLNGFKKAKGCAYPAFMQVLLNLVFEKDGRLRSDPDICAVVDLRQCCYLAYKYESAHKEHTIQAFLKEFVDVDESLGWVTPDLTSEASEILSVARKLLSDLFQGFDPKDIRPSHGPGSVATGEKNVEKMEFKRLYDTIHQVYPYYTYFYSNVADLFVSQESYKKLERLPSGIAKVVLVPKDSRGPRLISMEPLEYQWVQQGLSRAIVKYIEQHDFTRGYVNFSDQEVNRKLALQGSISGRMVTLDMKQASDRVSLWLVNELFADTPILRYLLGTRTEATELPNGVIHLMRKFAPMGSALCFPIEALTFWALGVATLNVVKRLARNKAMRRIYVYGDDIVVGLIDHKPLLRLFPDFKLLFNQGKCCAEGFFRESCGCDAFKGTDITVIKVKKTVPCTENHASGYAAYLSYANSMWNKAYYSTSDYILKYMTDVFGYIPRVAECSPVLGVHTIRFSIDFDGQNAGNIPRKWNKELQQSRYYLKTICTRRITRALDRSELLRKLLTTSEDFLAGMYTERNRVKIKKRWVGYYQKESTLVANR